MLRSEGFPKLLLKFQLVIKEESWVENIVTKEEKKSPETELQVKILVVFSN